MTDFVLVYTVLHRDVACRMECSRLRPVPEFIDRVLGMKMIVLAKSSSKRSVSIQSVPRDIGISLFWTRSDWGVVFKYWNCVEEEISLFSCPKSGHIKWHVFTKSVEFSKVESSLKVYKLLKEQILYHTRGPIDLGVGCHFQIENQCIFTRFFY